MYTPHTCELDIHGQYIYDIYKGQEAWKVCISPNYRQRIELFSPNEPAPNWLAGLIHSVSMIQIRTSAVLQLTTCSEFSGSSKGKGD